MLLLLCDTMTPDELNARSTDAVEAGSQNVFFANFDADTFLSLISEEQ
jgi:hypothetical protein